VDLIGVVIGEDDTDQEALDDVTSVIQFHLGTFGNITFQAYDLIGPELAKVVS
jgi:hypothetical protein